MDVRFSRKMAWGFGALAFGVKDSGFNYFFLIFYSQVMGVSAHLVSLALMIALIVDALSDPLIGYVSDNTRARWGRRHPFMYGAAIPAAIAYYFVWNPPAHLTGDALFPYIVTIAILVRTLITLYEIPSTSLVAEMTEDYDERTNMFSYRFFFGWTGGTLMVATATIFLLVPTDTISNGMFNITGYGQMGAVAAIAIFVAIMVSALGTHRAIPELKAPPPRRDFSLKAIYSEMFETLATRSFFGLLMAALFGAVASGLAAALYFYFSTFFWEFSAQQIGIIQLSVVISAVLALVIAPIVSRRMGKKRGAIVVGVVAFTVSPSPILLRLFGLMPENSDPILFPLVLSITVIDVALIIVYQILSSSMIADLVEEAEVKTKRRNEGVFFASQTFIRKINQGLGAAVAGGILTVIQFPAGVSPGEVPESVLTTLGWLYVPVILTLWALMIASLSLYSIDRDSHEHNLATLKQRS